MQVDYEALYGAWLGFKKGKLPSNSIDEFAYHLETNLLQLSSELHNKTYRHGSYKKIILREKKRRDLAVADVRDRVVHRLMYDYLLPIFDSSFDYDVWSCRKEKGLHKCLDRTQKLLQRYPGSYIWRADIIKFFDSVDHRALIKFLGRKVKIDDPALWTSQEITASYQVKPGRGIPIGNLTSQLFANVYLHEFDRFVRSHLKPQAYVRYGDDFVLFYSTRRQTFQARHQAAEFLSQQLKLQINPKNNIVIPASSGLKFLGHEVDNQYYLVDQKTTSLVCGKLDWHNIASYKSLYLADGARSRLDWILLEKYVDIL